jgi:hypothetical protein
MLQALLRLLGVDLNQRFARIGGQIGELMVKAVSQIADKAASQIAEQAKETGLTLALVLIGSVAALSTYIVALAALYLWVDMQLGPFAALGAVGLVTAALAALMFGLALWRRRKPAAAPLPRPPAASLPPPPSNASLVDVLRHRVSTRVAMAGDEALDTAAQVMRASSRSALFGTLAIAVLIGVLIGRRR